MTAVNRSFANLISFPPIAIDRRGRWLALINGSSQPAIVLQTSSETVLFNVHTIHARRAGVVFVTKSLDPRIYLIPSSILIFLHSKNYKHRSSLRQKPNQTNQIEN